MRFECYGIYDVEIECFVIRIYYCIILYFCNILVLVGLFF